MNTGLGGEKWISRLGKQVRAHARSVVTDGQDELRRPQRPLF